MNRLKNWNGVFVLGITGSMGSGKSFVSKIFEKIGTQRVDSDELARRYTAKDTPILKELVELFGEGILETPNVPDRKKIAEIVFRDKEKLKKLTDLIHPRIRGELRERIRSFPENTILAWEAPILFEVGADAICSAVVTVYSDYEIALQRAIQRDGISQEEFESRLKNQMDIKEKIKLSDFIIENNAKSSEELQKECEEILTQIQALYTSI
jgi:dephospho-CoA kinase